jgi:membrane protease YdiL (CAAX protease family)
MNAPRELSAAAAVGWSLLLTLGLVSVGVVVGSACGGTNLGVVVGSLAELALMLPAASFLAKLYGHGERSEALALKPVSPIELAIGASLGISLHVPAGYLSELVERRFPTPPEQLRAELLMLTPGSVPMALAMLLCVAVLVPYCEELFFRGALFTPLLRTGPALLAMWATSIAFVLAHQQPRNWPPLLLVALALAELRRASSSIWPGISLHAAFNGATLLVVFLTKPADVKAQHNGTWAAGLLGAIGCGLGLWLFGRAAARRLREERAR